MPFHPTGEASRMYSKYDEAQFHLRLPHELHAKIKQRAKMNNRGDSAHTSISLTVPPASLNFAIRLSALCSNWP